MIISVAHFGQTSAKPISVPCPRVGRNEPRDHLPSRKSPSFSLFLPIRRVAFISDNWLSLRNDQHCQKHRPFWDSTSVGLNQFDIGTSNHASRRYLILVHQFRFLRLPYKSEFLSTISTHLIHINPSMLAPTNHRDVKTIMGKPTQFWSVLDAKRMQWSMGTFLPTLSSSWIWVGNISHISPH